MNLNEEQQTEINQSCVKATKHWGNKDQMIALLEEMGELQVLIAKGALGKHERVENYEFKVADEMADVFFLLHQMEFIFDNHDLVKERILFKSMRLSNYIDQNKDKSHNIAR